MYHPHWPPSSYYPPPPPPTAPVTAPPDSVIIAKVCFQIDDEEKDKNFVPLIRVAVQANRNGRIVTVSEVLRKTVESEGSWIARLAQCAKTSPSTSASSSTGAGAVWIDYGCGYATLVLFKRSDEIPPTIANLPVDRSSIPRVGVDAVVAPLDTDETARIQNYGKVLSSDPLWEHLAAAGVEPNPQAQAVFVHVDRRANSGNSRAPSLLETSGSANNHPTDRQHVLLLSFREDHTYEMTRSEEMETKLLEGRSLPLEDSNRSPSLKAKVARSKSITQDLMGSSATVSKAKAPAPSKKTVATKKPKLATLSTPPSTTGADSKLKNVKPSRATKASDPKSLLKDNIIKRKPFSATADSKRVRPRISVDLSSSKSSGPEAKPATGNKAGRRILPFNPKEYILLAKAYDEILTADDLKIDASKYTKKDMREASKIMRHAQDEMSARGESNSHDSTSPSESDYKINSNSGKSKNTGATYPTYFNAKECLLLAKAFEDTLTDKDLRMDASKVTKKDVEKARKMLLEMNQGLRQHGSAAGEPTKDRYVTTPAIPMAAPKLQVTDGGSYNSRKENSTNKKSLLRQPAIPGRHGAGSFTKSTSSDGHESPYPMKVEESVEGTENDDNSLARGTKSPAKKEKKKRARSESATAAAAVSKDNLSAEHILAKELPADFGTPNKKKHRLKQGT
jgi:hypothetical protein